MPAKLIFLQGLPASGKTTWAKEVVRDSDGKIKRVNKDELREMIDGGKWSREREAQVLDIRNNLVFMWLSMGYDVIVDDTNFEPKHEEKMRELADHYDAEFEVKFFDVPVDECIKRDGERPKPVGEAVIRGMWNRYLKPVVPFISQAEDAIVCDLDGTLALLNGRNPYDATRCEEDGINHAVKEILCRFSEKGTRIVFVSGREAAHEEPTRKFLAKHGIKYDKLIMRKTGDNRKDAIIKAEIYEEYIKGHYNVLFVLDDRDQVVAMWRGKGLTCFQVDYGNF